MAKGEKDQEHIGNHLARQVGRDLRTLRELTRKSDHLLAKTTFALEELYAANDALKHSLDRLAISLPRKSNPFRPSKSLARNIA